MLFLPTNVKVIDGAPPLPPFLLLHTLILLFLVAEFLQITIFMCEY